MAYLAELGTFGIKPGLGRIKKLLELCENPQERYRKVHITGTNGKGSVTAMLSGILTQSGLHTGMFTSPHLVSYTERIQVDGQPISEEDFARYLSYLKTKIRHMKEMDFDSPTQFEVLTALAFWYFADKNVDYAVIEVGLGGLLDSTNVIRPEVSVITNVTLEHADKCGGTLEGVAMHKAGIIKDGVPVVTAAEGMPLEIIEKTAEEKNADVFVAGRDFYVQELETEDDVQSFEFSSALIGVTNWHYDVPLLGKYQRQNSALAVMTAELLRNNDEHITPESIAQALELIRWPGRFEKVMLGKQRVIIDGAHNPAGMQALRSSLDEYFPAEPRVFVMGILHDKNIRKMTAALLRPTDIVVLTKPDSERAAETAEVAGCIQVQHLEQYDDMQEALDRGIELANEEKLLCLTGSLYLIGELRAKVLAKKE